MKTRPEGKHVYYSLADEHVLTLIQVAQEHYEEEGLLGGRKWRMRRWRERIIVVIAAMTMFMDTIAMGMERVTKLQGFMRRC